jgi:hypothetical protein
MALHLTGDQLQQLSGGGAPVGCLSDGADYRNAAYATVEHVGHAINADPADRYRRIVHSTAEDMSFQFRQALRSRWHVFRLRREDMPERNIRRIDCYGACQLGIVMRRYTQPQTSLINGIKVGGVQVFLTQMYAISIDALIARRQ